MAPVSYTGLMRLIKQKSWEYAKQMLESSGTLNKQYDSDLDGMVEKIVAESVDSLPAPGKRGRLIVYNGKLYYDNGSEWI